MRGRQDLTRFYPFVLRVPCITGSPARLVDPMLERDEDDPDEAMLAVAELGRGSAGAGSTLPLRAAADPNEDTLVVAELGKGSTRWPSTPASPAAADPNDDMLSATEVGRGSTPTSSMVV